MNDINVCKTWKCICENNGDVPKQSMCEWQICWVDGTLSQIPECSSEIIDCLCTE